MMHTLATITGTGAVVPLSATNITARRVLIAAGTGNAGTVRCAGDTTTTSSLGQQLNAGDTWEMPPTPNELGDQYSLAGINAYIPNGDTLIVSYGD